MLLFGMIAIAYSVHATMVAAENPQDRLGIIIKIFMTFASFVVVAKELPLDWPGLVSVFFGTSRNSNPTPKNVDFPNLSAILRK